VSLNLAGALQRANWTPQTSGWTTQARPEQQPPDGGWFVWLIMAGRGWGKTRTGAEWLATQARQQAGRHFAVVARSTQDCRETCIEGPAGLLQALNLRIDSPGYNRTTGEIRLPNGAVIHAYSAEKPDRVRGPNLSGAWADELSSWRYPQAWTEGLIPALRIGRPRVVVTTTPKPVVLVKMLAARTDGSVHITRGSTFDNAANLSPEALTELQARYAGTRLGRQELEGELLDDVEGALWTFRMIDDARVTDAPDLERVVVAVDPAGGSGDDNDETGIVCAGIVGDEFYVLADRSCRASPNEWAQRALLVLSEFQGDRLVAEGNFGGQMVEHTIRSVDPFAPVHIVTASKGKRQRAEPVSALYEQGRVHHVGVVAELEDQMLSWVPDVGGSPDRMDALVWALTELAEFPVRRGPRMHVSRRLRR
jgi:phage terminase large subunit-like protein